MNNYEEIYNKLKFELEELINEYNMIESDYKTTTRMISDCSKEIEEMNIRIELLETKHNATKSKIYIGLALGLGCPLGLFIISKIGPNNFNLLLISLFGSAIGAGIVSHSLTKLIMKLPKYTIQKELIDDGKALRESMFKSKTKLLEKANILKNNLSCKLGQVEEKEEAIRDFESMMINTFLNSEKSPQINTDEIENSKDDNKPLVKKRKKEKEITTDNSILV